MATNPITDSLTAVAAARATDAHTWRPLRVLCIYRLVVAVIVLAGFGVGNEAGLLSAAWPVLFLNVAAAYAAFAAAALWLAFRHWHAFSLQVFIQSLTDVAAIALLVYASGSLDAGLGVLMVVAVAGNSLLLGMRLATFLAAVATLALLVQQMFAQLQGVADASGYTQAGLLSVAIFATALAGALMARRARDSDALAARRGVDVANLEALNAYIVQRLETGVVALDDAGRIRFMNRTGRELLRDREGIWHQPLTDVAPVLGRAYEAWRHGGAGEAEPLANDGTQDEFLPRFRPLGTDGSGGTLIFLENLTAMRAQVQQAKLASLGRLTASIAHEIRNPLSAMMHAAQLLGEADYLQDGEQRLTGIIRKQGRRLNTTVENVLQLSHQKPADRSAIDLGEWLPGFAEDWREVQGPALGKATLSVKAEPAVALFDPDHLRQILDNLLRNAIEHAGADGVPPRVRLRAQALPGGQPALSISDNGPGIDPAVRPRLFEPFTTSSSKGTGLGLYLVRELCEANQARIELVPGTTGTEFRIIFGRNAAHGA